MPQSFDTCFHTFSLLKRRKDPFLYLSPSLQFYFCRISESPLLLYSICFSFNLLFIPMLEGKTFRHFFLLISKFEHVLFVTGELLVPGFVGGMVSFCVSIFLLSQHNIFWERREYLNKKEESNICKNLTMLSFWTLYWNYISVIESFHKLRTWEINH